MSYGILSPGSARKAPATPGQAANRACLPVNVFAVADFQDEDEEAVQDPDLGISR